MTKAHGAFSAKTFEACPEGSGVTLADFRAYMPSHVYIFTPCREVWTGASVDARLPRQPVLARMGSPSATSTANA